MKKSQRKNTAKKNSPIKEKEDVQKSNDEHIDQDFPGYPHHSSRENIINPRTITDRIEAGIADPKNVEIYSNGSAGAFEATEKTVDNDDDSFFRKNK